MVVRRNRGWICALYEFSVGGLEISFACVSVKTNFDSSNANEGVKRKKITDVWVVTSCGLTI